MCCCGKHITRTDVLPELPPAGSDGMAFLYTWLRLSSQRQLPWYKRR